jgi:hypothetical protein
MSNEYRTDGLNFAYPSDWHLTEEQQPDGLSVMVSSAGTAFCSFLLMPERPPLKQVLDSALAAFRESYDEVDSDAVECRLAGRAARGFDVDFYCLELVNSAWLRAFRTGRYTVFMLFQAGFDEPEARSIFESICTSLDCNAEIGA